jgi:hypothetical protein
MRFESSRVITYQSVQSAKPKFAAQNDGSALHQSDDIAAGMFQACFTTAQNGFVASHFAAFDGNGVPQTR